MTHRKSDFKDIALKKNLLVFVLLFLFATTVSLSALDKDFALVYLRYQPLDLTLEISPDGPSVNAGDESDYILPKIDASTGDARFFLVKDSPLEREKFDTVYKYRVVFFKPQKLDGKTIKVPVYSIRLGFDSGTLSVKYEDGTVKTFSRSVDSGAYVIRDANGGDFNLSERMRTVKFTAWTRKLDITGANYYPLDPSQPMELLLTRKEAENDPRKGDTVALPAGREITVGMAPYVIGNADANARYRVKSVLVGSNEQPEPVVHFAEAWKNLYEQKIVVEDNGSWADIAFDDGLCQLRYSLAARSVITNIPITTNRSVLSNVSILTNFSVSNSLDAMSNILSFTNTAIRTNWNVATNFAYISNMTVVTNSKDFGSFTVDKSPFSFSLRALSGKSVVATVTAKDYALRYLDRAVEKISFDVQPSARGADLLNTLSNTYADNTRIEPDGALLILPKFGTTPFSVMSSPENAKIFVRRTEPISGRLSNSTIDLGQSPAFFPALEFGRYTVSAEWYDRSNAQLLTRRSETQVELSAYGFTERGKVKRELPVIRRGDTKIPYVEFKFDQSQPFSIAKSAPSAVTNTTSVSGKTVKPSAEPVQWLEEPVKTTVSDGQPRYYIQLGAFLQSGKNWRYQAASFLNRYLNGYRTKNGTDRSRECRFAEKSVQGKRYAVVIQGPYLLDQAREEVVRTLGILPQAFLVGPEAIRILEQ